MIGIEPDTGIKATFSVSPSATTLKIYLYLKCVDTSTCAVNLYLKDNDGNWPQIDQVWGDFGVIDTLTDPVIVNPAGDYVASDGKVRMRVVADDDGSTSSDIELDEVDIEE